MTYIPFLSTLVAFFFAAAVYRRFRERGGAHLLLWAIGLALYGLGTLSEALLSLTFSTLTLKVWYLTGAMLTAAWLGTGTVHLLVRKGSTARLVTWSVGILSVAALLLIMSAPTSPASYDLTRPASEQYRVILTRSGTTVLLTILLNIYGTIALVGGAIYSAYLFWRKKVLADRMYGNILIAAGALAPAVGGTFVRLGLVDLLYLSELVGAVVMFVGFVLTTRGKTAAAASGLAVPAGRP
jgi:hypothetical protein